MELIFWAVLMVGLCLALAFGAMVCNAIEWFTQRRRRPMATYRRVRS
jgi:hypothetical protein